MLVFFSFLISFYFLHPTFSIHLLEYQMISFEYLKLILGSQEILNKQPGSKLTDFIVFRYAYLHVLGLLSLTLIS